jgi:hypothetical protein
MSRTTPLAAPVPPVLAITHEGGPLPLALTVNERSVADRGYEDRIGISYEYPRAYQRRVRPGDCFVYYRGGRRADSSRQMPDYLGAGIIGEVRNSRQPDRLVCETLDYTPFPQPVPFRDEAGAYLEPHSSRAYFRQGVRPIPQSAYERILERAEVGGGAPSSETSVLDAATQRGAQPSLWHGASQEHITAVDEFAVSVALKELQRRFPGQAVAEQPHNNPGFDIRVGSADHPLRYVEVKGTQRQAPSFLLSEGQRRFSVENHDRFMLVVVFDIDLGRERYQLYLHEGPVDEATFTLAPSRWAVELVRRDEQG